MTSFSHLDEQGAARMVDVGEKPSTARRAVARATALAVVPEDVEKVAAGDPVEVLVLERRGR